MLTIILLFIGITGLIKNKIRISSRKEISGKPVTYLSIFYLIMAILPLFLKNSMLNLGLIMGAIVIITILAILFTPNH